MRLFLILGTLLLWGVTTFSQVFLKIHTLDEVVINGEMADVSNYDLGLTDAAISRNFKVKSTTVDLEIAGTNLTDRRSTTHLNWNGIPQMGRNVSFSLQWNFEESE